MNEIRSRTNRQLKLVLGACALGVLGVIAGIVIWDSRVFVGIALAWLLGAVLLGKQLFRCPLCGASVFLAPVSLSIPWITGRSRRCPRCRADYEEAMAETSGAARSSR